MSIILHVDMNSYFASVEQQANPHLRGKPVGVTGGDRLERTVLATASIEAKRLGVKTGMPLWQAKQVCPSLIIVKSNHDKYLSVTKRFLSIFKDYSPNLEVFSIDEAFLEVTGCRLQGTEKYCPLQPVTCDQVYWVNSVMIAREIKQRLKTTLGNHITCSIGISYNKLMAKLAGSLKKPDGLVIIPNQIEAIKVLDTVELDDICGIGYRIKKRLFNLGIKDFKTLRQVPKECLLASFKSYGEVLYNMARGIDHSPIRPFFEKEEVKSIGHRHTTHQDTKNPEEIKQILLKISEMIAQRLRAKKLLGKTIFVHLRKTDLAWAGQQGTLTNFTADGLEIFKTAWKIFDKIWDGGKIRMIGISVSNLKPSLPVNLSFLEDVKKTEKILTALDKVNNKFGDFTLQRAILLGTEGIKRKPNPFLSDRRFKL